MFAQDHQGEQLLITQTLDHTIIKGCAVQFKDAHYTHMTVNNVEVKTGELRDYTFRHLSRHGDY